MYIKYAQSDKTIIIDGFIFEIRMEIHWDNNQITVFEIDGGPVVRRHPNFSRATHF